VVIPKISLDTPVVPVGLVNQGGAITWDVPPFKVGHAEDTAGAGNDGNAVLVGHVTSRSLGNVFEHLREVAVGEMVQVFSNDQRFDYRVVDVRTVSRSDVSVVQPTDTPSVTLITCTGVWLPLVNDYSQREVVRAELASPRN
jgi:sortase A